MLLGRRPTSAPPAKTIRRLLGLHGGRSTICQQKTATPDIVWDISRDLFEESAGYVRLFSGGLTITMRSVTLLSPVTFQQKITRGRNPTTYLVMSQFPVEESKSGVNIRSALFRSLSALGVTEQEFDNIYWITDRGANMIKALEGDTRAVSRTL